jgi:membrane-associated phospholipid phosphatase
MKQLIVLAITMGYFLNIISAQNSSKTVVNMSNVSTDSLQVMQVSDHLTDRSPQIFYESLLRKRWVSTQPNLPYITSFKKDGPIILAGVGLTGLGVYLIQHKKKLTTAELATKTKGSIPFFDRGNAGFYSEELNEASYIPFYTSFAMPVVMLLINQKERGKFGQIAALYVETMAITGAMFTITAGAIDRSRPLVYGTKAPLSLRLAKKSQRSFYAGHTAATAAATFFAAKVFQDFNPDSKAKPYIWTIAAAIPAVTGYLRYKSGMHFLSDNVLGYVIGAATGILIPEWHKRKILKNVTITPETEFKGIALSYHF